MYKKIDLTQEEFLGVKKILFSVSPSREIWAFGSRVLGISHKKSDLDLVVFGSNYEELEELKEAFIESDLIFTVDILNWEDIDTSFRKKIKERYFIVQKYKKSKQETFAKKNTL